MGTNLAHLHLADGTGVNRDEHLVPGRGNQPCREMLEQIARRGLAGSVVIEVSTRRAESAEQREEDLYDSLVFARTHLAGAGEQAMLADGEAEQAALGNT
jgi:sugar phosphate isomerase/epimerase